MCAYICPVDRLVLTLSTVGTFRLLLIVYLCPSPCIASVDTLWYKIDTAISYVVDKAPLTVPLYLYFAKVKPRQNIDIMAQ